MGLFPKAGVDEVFAEWQRRQAHPSRVKLTADRRALIQARISRGYEAEDLIDLIAYAYEADTQEAKFWRGDSGGRSYLGLDNLLRVSKLSDRLDRVRDWVGDEGDFDADPADPADDGMVLGGIAALRTRLVEPLPVASRLRKETGASIMDCLKALRKETGASVKDCLEALDRFSGDKAKAERYLITKGQA